MLLEVTPISLTELVTLLLRLSICNSNSTKVLLVNRLLTNYFQGWSILDRYPHVQCVIYTRINR